MITKIVTLTGPSGVGKSSVLARLLENSRPKFVTVTSVTTRGARPSDVENEYEYVTDERFQNLNSRGEFIWTAEVRGKMYGTSESSIEKLLEENRVGVMILVPERVLDLRAYFQRKGLFEKYSILSIFIEGVPEVELRRRMLDRGDDLKSVESSLSTCRSWKQRAKDYGFFDFISNRQEEEPGSAVARQITIMVRRRKK